MASEARRIGRSNRPYPKDTAGLGRIVCSVCRDWVAVDGGSGGAGRRRGYYRAVTLVAPEDGVVLCSREEHGGEEDCYDQLERKK